MASIVTYYRVGVKADQRQAVRDFVAEHKVTVVAGFTERGKSLSALEKAIHTPADLLVIAYVGKLVRHEPFTTLLQTSGVKFICCDRPDVNHDTIHMVAEQARDLAQRISRQVRDTLGELKSQGKVLGLAQRGRRRDPASQAKAVKASSKARTQRSRAAYEFIIPKMKQLHVAAEEKAAEMQELAVEAAREVRERMEPLMAAAKDAKTLDALKKACRLAQKEARLPYSYPVYEKIAEQLTEMGHRTVAGYPFNGPIVYRLLQQAAGRKPRKIGPRTNDT